MAKRRWRTASGRFTKRRASANPGNPRRRRRSRRNPIANLMGNRRRGRRARRNPPNGGFKVLGVSMPGLQSIAFGTVGFLGPPMIEGYAAPYLPANFTANKGGRYVIKLASSLGLAWAAKAFAGHDAAVKVGMGAGIYLAASLINDFMPTLTGAQPAAAYYPRLAAQPLLGDYARAGANLSATAPERLRAQNRY